MDIKVTETTAPAPDFKIKVYVDGERGWEYEVQDANGKWIALGGGYFWSRGQALRKAKARVRRIVKERASTYNVNVEV